MLKINFKSKFKNMVIKSKSKLSYWVVILCFLFTVRSVSATDTSGACIVWLLFTFAVTASGSAYMFYLVYILKQPLGKKHGAQNAAPAAQKRDTDGKKQIEERKEKLASEEVKKDIDKNNAPVGRDPRQANFATPPKIKEINIEDVKVNISEKSSDIDDPRAQARKNYPPPGFYGEPESNDSPPNIQRKYTTKPQEGQGKPIGVIARPSEGKGVGRLNIEEDDEDESEDDEELDNSSKGQQQSHYQRAGIAQRQPG